MESNNSTLLSKGLHPLDIAAEQMQFWGQFKPQVDQVIWRRYFAGAISDGVTVECGAFDGVLESSTLFFNKVMGWKSINIEASPPIYKRLKTLRPDAVNIHAALSDDEGTISFTHAYHPVIGENFGNGSVSHSEGHRADLDAQGCTYRSWEVPKTTYKKLMNDLSISRVDLFVLDIEGHELAAIKGMRGSTALPSVICVEVGQLGFEAVNASLIDLGYTYDMAAEVNAFYVRNDRRPAFEARLRHLGLESISDRHARYQAYR